jgi:hypothetical protein
MMLRCATRFSLCFGVCVVVLNDLLYEQGSTCLIFFKTCIARFSLRGPEQSGNKANNRGKHKAQEHKGKKTQNKTNEIIYDDQVSRSPESPLGPTFVLPPKYVALGTPAGARLSHEHANPLFP